MRTLTLVVPFLAVFSVCCLASAQTYTAVHITGADGSEFRSYALNNNGVVVGTVAIPNSTNGHAAIWQNGTTTDLGLSEPDAYSCACSVNDQNLCVGNIGKNGAQWKDSTLLSSFPSAFPADINNSSQVVGSGSYTMGISLITYAYLRKDGVETALAQSMDGPTHPVAINNNGAILGYASVILQGYDRQEALTFDNGNPAPLQPPFYDATDLNDRGEILGQTASQVPSIWKGGIITTVPMGDGLTSALPTRINNRSQMVGSAWLHVAGTSRSVAVLWDGGAPKVLETHLQGLMPQLTGAVGINDRGQILAMGDGTYLLTPVYGDANGDFKVDMADATMVLRAASGLGSVLCPWICDVAPAVSTYPGGFGDGSVDILDAVRVLRFVAGTETSLP
jgi:uncharacterized membrane protein